MEGVVRVALAQYRVKSRNIAVNMESHKELCVQAAHLGANIITFPELSLTGYEPELLSELAINRSSPLIEELSSTAVSNGLTIIVGCPLRSEHSTPYIGAVVLHASGEVNYYQKQYLHEGENNYCVAGDDNYFFSVNNVKVGLAVCADFTEPMHYSDAKAANVDIYLVSALISKKGFSLDSELLSSIAKKLDVPVLLSNFVGKTGGWDTAGKCSVWDSEGEIVVQGSEILEGITVCTITNGKIDNMYFQSLDKAGSE
ncbi:MULTISPECIES: carbon-nitrogen hydrolase family protein [unclassified Vibrio]|uniref:carbon-nitrogen hydrolase family protein n=1 Tax=unclassified Vibrio TaxID=2614977 RepID=UPI00354AE292